MLITPALRVLTPAELGDTLAVLDRDPVANAFVTARVLDSGLEMPQLGGEMWGWYHRGRLRSLCYSGANLVPLCATPAAVRAFAARALRQQRTCSSIVGPATQTAQLWSYLEPHWGPARTVRARQPLMATGVAPVDIVPDPLVRRMRKDEMDLVLPAAVAMFVEEVGLSPLDAEDGGLAYQSRVAETLGTGRCFARVEDGRIVFKAEIGAVTPHTCQLQGVWTAPGRRGQGLATAGLAAVLRHALAEAPVVSLYVNDFNAPALAVYRRLGFTEIGSLMSVLF